MAIAGGVLVGLPEAEAAPPPTLTEVQRRVDQLNLQVDQITERFDATRERLAGLHVRVAAAQTRLAQERGQFARAQAAVGRLAAEEYRRGELGALSLWFADDPTSYLETAGLAATLAQRRIDALTNLQRAQAQLAADIADAGRVQSSVTASVASMQADRQSVVRLLGLAQAQLDRLKAGQRLALARASRSADRVPLGASCASLGITAANTRVKAVLDFACAQLGEPYQFGADGPGSWDCSGLTMMAWRQAGVSLPHSSALQATYGTRITAAQLQPGDLVFYHVPISHVALYVGQNLMLDAPQTGDVVKIHALRPGMTAAVHL